MIAPLQAVDAGDPAFVPRFRAGVAAIPVADEAVLYEEDTGALHQLDPIATVVCGMFDGRTSTGQAVDELAAAFGADRDVVEADVLRLVRQLAGVGLLDGLPAHAAPADDPDVS